MQVGILCAAALVALQENLGKQSDHNKAKLLAGKCHTIILTILIFLNNYNLYTSFFYSFPPLISLVFLI